MIQTTHSILAGYIYKGHQPASMGSRRVVSSMAYLNKALEHLEEKKTENSTSEVIQAWKSLSFYIWDNQEGALTTRFVALQCIAPVH